MSQAQVPRPPLSSQWYAGRLWKDTLTVISRQVGLPGSSRTQSQNPPSLIPYQSILIMRLQVCPHHSSGPRFARPPLGGLYITKVICWVRRPRPPTKKVNKNYINIPYRPISAHAGGSHAYGTFMRRGYDDSTTRPRRMRAMCASRGIESYRPQPRHGARV